MSHTRHFVLLICEIIRTGIWSNYLNNRYYSGCKKILIPNTKYYLVLRKSEYRIQILLFSPTIRIVFEYRIIRHTLFQKIPCTETQNLCIIRVSYIICHMSWHFLCTFWHFLYFFDNVCCLRQNSKLKLHCDCNMG